MGSEPASVIVTGTSSGIGRGIAEVLIGQGYDVIGFDIAPVGVGFREFQLDVANGAVVADAVERVAASVDRLVGVVNNAAIGPLGTVLDTDEDTFDRIMDVNAKGTFNVSRAVLPHLTGRGGGSIVNIGSGAGHGKKNMAAYAASKAAVHALTMSMSRDHFDQRVRVNTVIPGGGGIPTGISLARFGGTEAEYSALAHRGSVAGRPVRPGDVGETVAFLLSDAAVTISGTVIDLGCMAGQGES